jgi:parallel beta-helix repeat protein
MKPSTRSLGFALVSIALLGLLVTVTRAVRTSDPAEGDGTHIYTETRSAPTQHPTDGTHLYVDGASRNGRCSDRRPRVVAMHPTAPLCTLSRASALAEPGDIIHIAGATYRESLVPSRSGSVSKPISFVADSSDVVIDAQGGRTGIKVVARSYVNFSGMTVTGAATQGIWVDGSVRVTFSSLTVKENRGPGIQLRNSIGTTIRQSSIIGNLGAGVQELKSNEGSHLLDNTISRNGWDSKPYNGDGIQLVGSGAIVRGNTITGNGDNSVFEHGLYASAAADYLIERNIFANNAAANIKAQGSGTVRYNRLGTATTGIYVDHNGDLGVKIYYNVLGGSFRNGAFFGDQTKADVWNNTIVNDTTEANGQPTAVFVRASRKLDLRNNLLISRITTGRAIAIPSVASVRDFTSEANWYAASNIAKPMVWGSASISFMRWKQATSQDRTSLASLPPVLSAEGRIASSNLGANRGDRVGLPQDITGSPIPAGFAPTIGAYQ